jgi:lysophospholipase L1-like esterase
MRDLLSSKRATLGLRAASLLALALAFVSATARAQDEVRIEDPTRNLSHFFERLRAAEGRRPGAIARISMYGESTNATDRVTSAIRRQLQATFGDSGKGFIPVVPGWPTQMHQDASWTRSGPWQTWIVNRRGHPLQRYGLGGVLAQSRNANARARFATVQQGSVGRAVSRFTLFYQAYEDGGAVQLSVDGAAPSTVETQATEIEDRVHTVEVADGAHALELRPADDRPVRLYGVVMERDRPGVVVDGLMLVGAFTRVLGQFDRAHWQRQIALRETDLLVFWMGGNDAIATSTGFSPTRYVADFERSIRTARAGRPAASCLIVSVMDAAEATDGRIRTLDRIPRVVDAQREVATRTNCAFFDLFHALGGPGTMARWRQTRLSEGDFHHLTPSGAEAVGTKIVEALLASYRAR